MKFKLCISIVALLLLVFESANAQKHSTVVSINGKKDPLTMEVMPDKGNKRNELNVGDLLYSGTKLIIPPNTVIQLATDGGGQTLRTKKFAMDYEIKFNAKNHEDHIVSGIGATIFNKVTKRLNYEYKNNNGKGTSASSWGTEFSFTDQSSGGIERATVSTSEGTVGISDEVPLRVGGQILKDNQGNNITKSVLTTQNPGGTLTTDDNAISFNTPQDAKQAIFNEINAGTPQTDDWAVDNICLADLYMEDETQASSIKAVQRYKSAVNYLANEYGFDDDRTIDANVSLAYALTKTGNAQDEELSQGILKSNIIATKNKLYALQEELNFVDQEDRYLICDDIKEYSDLLADLYDLSGDEAQGTKYRNQAANCR